MIPQSLQTTMMEGRGGEEKHFCNVVGISIQRNGEIRSLIAFVSTSFVQDCSWGDGIFTAKRLQQEQESPWAFTLTERVPEAFEIPPSDWPDNFSGQSASGISNVSGTRSVRVNAQGHSRSCCKLSPVKIPSPQLAAPGSPRMGCVMNKMLCNESS